MGPLLTDAGEIKVKRYEPFRFMPNHRHEFDKVSFMLSGGVRERRGASERYAEAGWAVVKPADVLHDDESDDGTPAKFIVSDKRVLAIEVSFSGQQVIFKRK